MTTKSSMQRDPAAALVLPCSDLDATLSFFTEKLGFRLDLVFPADHPSVMEISGHGLRIRLQRGEDQEPVLLRMVGHDLSGQAGQAGELIAPNGTRIQLVNEEPELELPPLQASFVLNRASDDARWKVGRAGMRYRDLIPDRQGGRYIASHIVVPDGGPVPDYVHFHRIHFQMIYCYKGWVRVVYEDQGPPFMLEEGDCVLQPPRIRHRVLESSPGLEVIEISCPAEHETQADHEMTLPTGVVRTEREFDSQRFLHHMASGARWSEGRLDGFRSRDIGIATATEGTATGHVLRPTPDAPSQEYSHNAEFLFLFVLEGAVDLRVEEGRPESLGAGDSVVIPAGMGYALGGWSPELEMLEVGLPAGFETNRHPG